MPPVVLVEDNGPIDVSKLTPKAVPQARKHWLTVEWLPKYCTRNERTSRSSGMISRRTSSGNHTFAHADALDCAIQTQPWLP